MRVNSKVRVVSIEAEGDRRTVQSAARLAADFCEALLGVVQAAIDPVGAAEEINRPRKRVANTAKKGAPQK